MIELFKPVLHTSRFNRDKIGKSRFFQNADSNHDFYPKNRPKFFLTIFIEKIAIFSKKSRFLRKKSREARAARVLYVKSIFCLFIQQSAAEEKEEKEKKGGRGLPSLVGADFRRNLVSFK